MFTPSDSSRARRHAQFLCYAPRLWAYWPFLPVIRRHPNGDTDYGVLFDARGHSNLFGYSATVFRFNVFALPQTVSALLAGPREVFYTVEELLDHGWTVD